MATKDDLLGMATKDDLLGMATKDDLLGMATKDDLMEQSLILAGAIEGVRTELKEEIKASETRIEVIIENRVSDQIRALFDGYKGALENQALLKAANHSLAQELDHIKMRLAALENRIA